MDVTLGSVNVFYRVRTYNISNCVPNLFRVPDNCYFEHPSVLYVEDWNLVENFDAQIHCNLRGLVMPLLLVGQNYKR